MYSKGTLNSGMSPPTRINLPPMKSTHSIPHPPPAPPSSFHHEEEYSKKTATSYYPYKLPALHESSSSIYSYPSTSSPSYYYAQQHHHTYSVEQSPLPPTSSTISSSYSQQHPPPPPLSQMPPSLSRPPTSTSDSSTYQQEKTYYPIYSRRQPTVAVEEESIEVQEEEEEDIEENSKMKRKREMTERMTGIDREFKDNKEFLYREKLKQLQEELNAVERGQHKGFDESITDLEEKRKEMIQNAKLIMFYQISSVDHLCHLNYRLVEEESLAEQRELQNAMFSIIEEKRKRLKEYKDGEFEPLSIGHQTRFQKRTLRKRGESETPPSKISKRKPDRSKENVGQLLNVLDINDEEVEADFEAMMADIAKINKKTR